MRKAKSLQGDTVFNWLRTAIDTFGAPRSGRWRTVREEHLRREPFCQACEKAKDLEVHHVTPVHAGGDELSPLNLVTLCRDCHYTIGHGCDWRAWRPDVRALAAKIRRAERKRL